MNEEKKLSVIVPVYNVEKYLNRCVDSILGQTYQNMEIILVDDGSPDNCGAICDEYASFDPRIQVIHKENGGLSDARNFGMRKATGEYITFLDSDDFIHHRMYEVLISKLEEYGADIAECSYKKFVKDPEEEEYTGEEEVLVNDTEQALTQLMDWSLFDISVWNKVYKRELVEGIEFPFGKINEDEFWTYQIVARAKKCIHVFFTMHYYQQARTGSILTNKFSEKNFDSTEALLERVPYIKENFPQLTDIAERAVLAHFYHHCRNFVLFEDRPKSEWIGYFYRFEELYRSLPQEYLDAYSRWSKIKAWKIKKTNKMLAKSDDAFLNWFARFQKTIYAVKLIIGKESRKPLE